MDNGGFNNIESLHMSEFDTERNKMKCSFYNDYDKTCFFLGEKCFGSSHCEHYTEDSKKAIEKWDEKFYVHSSSECEFIDLSEKSPICKRDGFGQLCFGIGARFCPKNSAKSINNQNPEKKDVIEYGDYVELLRREKTKDIVLQIPKISLFNKLTDSLVGKKLNDEVLFNNNLWIIKTIDKREEKMPQFVIHKKNQKTHID